MRFCGLRKDVREQRQRARALPVRNIGRGADRYEILRCEFLSRSSSDRRTQTKSGTYTVVGMLQGKQESNSVSTPMRQVTGKYLCISFVSFHPRREVRRVYPSPSVCSQMRRLGVSLQARMEHRGLAAGGPQPKRSPRGRKPCDRPGEQRSFAHAPAKHPHTELPCP